MFKVNNEDNFTPCSIASIVTFEQANDGWVLGMVDKNLLLKNHILLLFKMLIYNSRSTGTSYLVIISSTYTRYVLAKLSKLADLLVSAGTGQIWLSVDLTV